MPEAIEIIPREKEQTIESIRSSRLRYKKLEYRANQLGANEDPEYYPASNFKYSPYLLKKFYLDN